MKGSIKKKLCIGLAGLVAAGSISAGGYYLVDSSKKWMNNRIEQGITKYGEEAEQKGRERENRLRNYTDSSLREYEQRDQEWTNENFEIRVPLEQLLEAFEGTYQVVNQAYYETREGEIINPGGTVGSGILLRGGYLLTAKHVVDEGFPMLFSDYYWGLVSYHHHELSIGGHEVEVEKIIEGRDMNLDYALLKLNSENLDLPFYDYGLNTPSEPVPGMRSAAIGFALGRGKNIRLGNLSQIISNVGEDYFTFKNSIIPGDSGGPLFVVENGEIKLTAISTRLAVLRDWNHSDVYHPVNVGYGLKVESILDDIQERLESGELDEETVNELETFLRANSP